MRPTIGRVYVAGPMTGIPQFNFPVFDEAAADLRARGFDIVSPAELDDPETREAALASPDGAPGTGSSSGETWADFLSRDVKLIADEVKAIAVLPGWDKSRGARLETFVARLCGIPVFAYDPDQEPLEELTDEQLDRVLGYGDPGVPGVVSKTTEIRVTDPKTGGQKGQKIERFDLIPAEFERQLALVYGAGATKYDDDNWRKGYDYRLSLGALRRHLNLWQQGEEHDADTSARAGEPVSHLAAAAWHCATLMTFVSEGLGTDNIPERAAA